MRLLYDLLSEREPHVNISHKRMPTWQEHTAFVVSDPYQDWCFIEVAGNIAGAIYLTKADEIGIHLFKKWQGNGIGPEAVKLFMKKHGSRRYLANINPANEASRQLWQKLGFTKIQETYALESLVQGPEMTASDVKDRLDKFWSRPRKNDGEG